MSTISKVKTGSGPCINSRSKLIHPFSFTQSYFSDLIKMLRIVLIVSVLHLGSSHVITKRGIPVSGTSSSDQLSANAYAQSGK